MGILNQYAADRQKEESGVWVDFGDPNDPIRFKLARFARGIEAEVLRLDPEKRQLAREGRLPDRELIELLMEATSRRVILDWQNMQEVVLDEAGQPVLEDGRPKLVDVPYSPEKALEILRDDRYAELHEFIVHVSKDRARFRADLLEASRKN